jgi:hypothetical protein
MPDFLGEFVTHAGIALEVEDRRLAGAGRIRNEAGGIRRAGDNERFFQAVVWRAVFDKWPALMEYKSQDLVIFANSDYRVLTCVFEMKTWLGTGGPNITEIRKDITKLQNCGTQDSGLIIFSANNRGALGQQLASFETQIFQQQPPLRRETYCFDILYSNPPSDTKSYDQEFWMTVWPIKSGPLLRKP